MLCLYPDWVLVTHKTYVKVTSNKSLFPQRLIPYIFKEQHTLLQPIVTDQNDYHFA